MPSYYCVVQYLPDPIRDERVNLGVLAYSEDGAVRAQFVRDWTRIRNFAGRDIDFLREFANDVVAATAEQQALPLVGQPPALTPEAIGEMSRRWINSIQLTEPRASLLPVDELMPRMAGQFLAPKEQRQRAFRDRRAAVGVARRSLQSAVAASAAAKKQKVRVASQLAVAGQFDHHLLDAGLQNGKPLLGVKGISFEGPTSKELQREVDATAWTVDDIKRQQPDLPIAVLVLPPQSGKGKTFETARRVLTDLGAQVVEESDAATWAVDVTRRVLA